MNQTGMSTHSSLLLQPADKTGAVGYLRIGYLRQSWHRTKSPMVRAGTVFHGQDKAHIAMVTRGINI
jgi:hypothetical protein